MIRKTKQILTTGKLAAVSINEQYDGGSLFNPYLLMKYDCDIKVECFTSVAANKYIGKGQ